MNGGNKLYQDNEILTWVTMYRVGETYQEIAIIISEPIKTVEKYIQEFIEKYPLPYWASHQIYRTSGLLENICKEHGVGHPSKEWLAIYDSDSIRGFGVHGCCGCCVSEDIL